MREAYIKKLIRLVEESKIESLEISSWGRKIKITQPHKHSANGDNHKTAVLEQVVYTNPNPTPGQLAAPASAPATPQPAPVAVADSGKTVIIKSPMVGTFYSAPSPEAAPYVSVNQKVTAGQVVCIVEAMKLMNEIESEFSGRVIKIMAENGTPVEFGQDLFLIEPE
ncbi:MAG: acetyl-CoA carboxylase biotin carboxyl carrier protein [Candidatus Zixiibacteriota bacterium]